MSCLPSFDLGTLAITDHGLQESHDFIKIIAGDDADTLAERAWWLEIEDDCWASTQVAPADSGKMGDWRASAGEVIGDDKIVALHSDLLDRPGIYQYKYEPNTPEYRNLPWVCRI